MPSSWQLHPEAPFHLASPQNAPIPLSQPSPLCCRSEEAGNPDLLLYPKSLCPNPAADHGSGGPPPLCRNLPPLPLLPQIMEQEALLKLSVRHLGDSRGRLRDSLDLAAATVAAGSGGAAVTPSTWDGSGGGASSSSRWGGSSGQRSPSGRSSSGGGTVTSGGGSSTGDAYSSSSGGGTVGSRSPGAAGTYSCSGGGSISIAGSAIMATRGRTAPTAAASPSGGRPESVLSQLRRQRSSHRRPLPPTHLLTLLPVPQPPALQLLHPSLPPPERTESPVLLRSIGSEGGGGCDRGVNGCPLVADWPRSDLLQMPEAKEAQGAGKAASTPVSAMGGSPQFSPKAPSVDRMVVDAAQPEADFKSRDNPGTKVAAKMEDAKMIPGWPRALMRLALLSAGGAALGVLAASLASRALETGSRRGRRRRGGGGGMVAASGRGVCAATTAMLRPAPESPRPQPSHREAPRPPPHPPSPLHFAPEPSPRQAALPRPTPTAAAAGSPAAGVVASHARGGGGDTGGSIIIKAERRASSTAAPCSVDVVEGYGGMLGFVGGGGEEGSD